MGGSGGGGSFVEFFGGFEFGTFLGDDADELAAGLVPRGEEFSRLDAAGFFTVLLDECFDFLEILRTADGQGDDHLGVDAGEKFSIHVVDVGGAAGHPSTEVFPGFP